MSTNDDLVAGEMRERLIPRPELRRLGDRIKSSLFAAPNKPWKIDRYTVIESIGSGGMGTVYKTFDNKLDRLVAVKVLRKRLESQERLARESQALAKLSHPNVVQVYDVGEADGDLFISMEYIDGPTLSSWVRDEPRSWREILAKYMEAGRGLAAAHAAGIIHRDFKPINVLVGNDGRVRVLDFGLARGREVVTRSGELQADTFDPAVSGVLQTPITGSGAIMGTVPYMSPEQHRGEEADERADQFSYCVALYEALYGSRPFAGKLEDEIRNAVLAGRIEAAPADARVPVWIRRLLLVGLSVDRARRHASMDELLESLGRDPARLVRWAGIAVGAALVTGGAAFLLQTIQEVRVEAKAERVQKLAERERAEALMADAQLREDALTLAEVTRFDLARDPTAAIARLKHLSPEFEGWEGATRTLAADADYRGVAKQVVSLPPGDVPHGLSPDGRIVITRKPESGLVQTLDIATGRTRRLGVATGGMPEAEFSADGSRLAALRLPDELQVWDTDALSVQSLGASPDEHFELVFGPRGGIITFGRHPELHRWSGATKQVFGDHQDTVTSVAVHPQGTSMATVDSYGRARLWDLKTAEPRPLLGVGPVAFSPSGKLAIATGDGDVDVHDLLAEESVRYAGRGAPVEALVFPPSSERMAAGFGDGYVGIWQLQTNERLDFPIDQERIESIRFVDETILGTTDTHSLALVHLEGGSVHTLRGHQGVGWWAVRPGGAVVTLGREGTIRLWDLPPTRARPLDGHEGPVHLVAYGLDGAFVTAGSDGTVRRWTADVAGVVLADHVGERITAMAVSDDGRRLVSADATGRVLLRSIDSEDDAVLLAQFPGLVRALAWASDGRVAVAHPEGGVAILEPGNGANVRRLTAEGLQVKAVHFSADDERLSLVGWTPEERFFLVVLGDDGEELSRTQLKTEGILAVDFSGDDRYLAFSSFDRSLQVYDTHDAVQRRLGSHDRPVEGLCFAPDSRTLATAGVDGVAKLWDLPTGYVRPVSLTDKPLRGIAFTRDANEFVAVGDEATARFGRDDLPRDPERLKAWVEGRTDLVIEANPSKWSRPSDKVVERERR